MSKTNDASKLANQDSELRDDELDAVSGGLVVNAVIAVLIHLLLPSDVGTKTPV
jgi:hypothetical protein